MEDTMKKLLTALILTLTLLLSTPAIAAEKVSWSHDRLTCTIRDVASDWDYRTYFPGPRYANGIRVYSIRFHPGATNDLCSIEDYDDNNVKHFLVKCADTYDDRIQGYNGARLKLFLDFDDTDGTWTAAYTAGCSVTIQLWHTQEDD